ncbi:MAG: hypothetical protein Ta2F_17870 [Termitinemataceae bacterium]|nr:MAG: hypothetical protein Ta2F_17870 [Termitinemataceae bacterium]
MLDVLKTGVDFGNGCKLNLMYRKPATSFNELQTQLYNQNILSVMEEVNHKEGERIDLVIFLNGLAIFSFELKCNTTGQDYNDAIKQYKLMRDYKARLFKYKSGVLVAFAMDLNEVYMTTELKGRETAFLPFNKGNGEGIDAGSGNPHNEDGICVSYMWEDILKKETVIYLIDNYIYNLESDIGKRTHKSSIIFPRYHQFNAVRKISEDMKINKSSKNYLIQHSAGSGKTNTIAWLAHRLTSLHDSDDKIIFDTVAIITDRIVVDRQHHDAVMSIEHKAGLIKVMDDKCTSADLIKALNGNTKIIVSTIQKFGYVYKGVKELSKKTFAIIIDEAHSSTSGDSMAKLTTALSKSEEDGEELSTEDKIIKTDIPFNLAIKERKIVFQKSISISTIHDRDIKNLCIIQSLLF